ncbi:MULTISPECIES: phage tail protein [Chryseobacterium]|jgi:Microcystin-dependent protein|uniref:Phage tail protein n=1 Tax=Chryseobacterium rhizosphaerae TaxID=395937 RepID=A0ABX9IDP1_9FLAO|nr:MULTISPECIES: tail fiber protein [Chryseobacterium]MBL3549554.1 tail fiber protein [Chryseobacterium sp. KMC2]MDC8101829.1 tail fiber protein [Chryseobacterium rhizosphaerae]MDR6547663.1 microcystin-dependent protein [Chryseobacterium rhizosphaerae]REC69984.1 phage tail protein [Chryseobacterium rhizosphaerae]GEN69776.1 microcystin dependent MdpB family protein [Chryseobacterium rhizosphaerae]
MEEYMGIVKLFAGSFVPRGWMLCDGRLLSIAQNSALFSLLGTIYGGDGISTFALPNLIGRMALGAGTQTGKSYPIGMVAGTDQNTLLQSNLPSFGGLQLKVSKSNATTSVPSSASSFAVTGTQSGRDFTAVPSYINAAPDTVINTQSISYIGQNLPVNNMPPFSALNYIICVAGIYPPRD